MFNFSSFAVKYILNYFYMLEKGDEDFDLEKDFSNCMHSNNNKCRSCYEVHRYHFAKTTKTRRPKKLSYYVKQ